MLRELFDLTGKKALVTGGSIGLGRACATALAMAGADVAIIGRTRKSAERTCVALRELGVDASFVECDVADRAQVAAMLAEVIHRFGRLDIAVNNAGAGILCSALSMQEADWDRMIDLNLGGVFWCARAEAEQMSKQQPTGGKIINIASMYGLIAAGNCAYSSAKAAVIHLTKLLASEWGGANINVNCISPGWLLTSGNRMTPEIRAQLRGVTPLGSLMKYEDVYGATLLLASAASDFMTGHNLVIDGGHSLTTYPSALERVVSPRTTPEEEQRGLNEDLEAG